MDGDQRVGIMKDLARIALRLSLAESESLEAYEVVLERDLSDFENERTRSAVMVWPKQVQKRMQVGYQFVGRFAFHPIIIGSYADIHFGAVAKPTPYITYLTANFDKFASRLGSIARKKNLTLDFGRTGDDVYMPEYGCRVLGDKLLVETFESQPLCKFFGYNMAIAKCTTSAGELDQAT